METSCDRAFHWFLTLGLVCLALVPARAGLEIVPDTLVEPGGVEVPLLVNVIGPEKGGDVQEVEDIIRAANRILLPANVQLAVSRVNTGILVGNEDSRIQEDEFGVILFGSLFELTGSFPIDGAGDEDSASDGDAKKYYGLRKGVKLNIADDIYVEQPDRTYFDWQILPVAFLERAGSIEETARNLAYGLSLTLRVPGSTDPGNLLFPGGTGTDLNAGQGATILEGVRPIGMERSSIAQGFAPDVLQGLHHSKNLGALFYSEPQGWAADFGDDVFFERDGESGEGPGDADLIYIKARFGSPRTPTPDRYLILKAVLNAIAFPDSGGIDLYLSAQDRNDPSDLDVIDVITGAQGTIGFGNNFAGAIDQQGLWNPIDEAKVQTTLASGLTQLRAEIPLAALRSLFPEELFNTIESGGRLTAAASANVFGFDGVNVSFEDDILETPFKIAPVPRPIGEVPLDARLAGPGSGSPGFWTQGGKADAPFQVDRDNVHTVKGDFFGGVTSLSQQGTRTSQRINFYDSSTSVGDFTSANGFPNETFPGIDDLASSPGNPAGGDDDDYTGFQVVAIGDFPAGLNILGVNISENMGFCLTIGGQTVAQSFRGLFADDGANGFAEPDDDALSVLRHHDCPFFVEQAGRYAVHLQVLHTTGGSSLEFQQVLPNGDRILAGDTLNGGVPFDVPPQGLLESILAGMNGGGADGGNGGGNGGMPSRECIDFENTFFILPPLSTFGDGVFSVNFVDEGRAAQISFLPDDATASLEATLETGNGSISFDFRVSSEEGFDFLRFSLNGVEQEAWSGEQQGTHSVSVSAGTNAIRFDYAKDGSSSGGQDTAWVDNICWPVP